MEPESQGIDNELESAGISAEFTLDDSSSPSSADLDGDAESLREEQRKPLIEYPVVGIGASAGGLQAFQELLGSLDPKTGWHSR